jgi:hypothetical protein
MRIGIFLFLLASLSTVSAFAETENFDSTAPGSLPSGWVAGVTGSGSPHWAVEADSSAPSAPNVLRQSGQGQYPWCVRSDARLNNGTVEVKFKPLSGTEDQAGGIVWRFQDANTYYIARANALENNVSLYHVENGIRKPIKYVDAPVAGNQWHRLRVEFAGTHIKVELDGKTYIDLEDGHIAGSGAIGVWTKADSVTSFDDFTWNR